MKKAFVQCLLFTLVFTAAHAQWVTINGTSGYSITAVLAVNDSIILAGDNDGIFRSVDSGRTWSHFGASGSVTVNDVHSFGISDTNVIMGQGGGHAYRSNDHGASWSRQHVTYGTYGYLAHTYATLGNKTFAGTTGYIFETTDNGYKWYPIQSSLNILGAEVRGLAIIGNDIYAGAANGYGVHLSTNNGVDWAPVNTGLTNHNVTALVASGTTLFAGTDTSGVFRSTDGGSSWLAVNNGLPNRRQITTMAATDNMVFAGFTYGVYVSTNNGNTWMSEVGLNTYVFSLSIYGNYIYAGSHFGVSRRALPSVVGTCSANYSLSPDTVAHHYIAVNTSTGRAPITYRWNWGDGSFDTIPYPTHLYDSAGTYNICLSITDADGCSDTLCQSHFLQKSPDEIVQVTVVSLTTGVIEREEEIVSLFPNPAGDYLMINLKDNREAHLKVYSVTGEQKLSIQITQNTRLNIASWANGVYMMEVSAGNKRSVGKFVKK